MAGTAEAATIATVSETTPSEKLDLRRGEKYMIDSQSRKKSERPGTIQQRKEERVYPGFHRNGIHGPRRDLTHLSGTPVTGLSPRQEKNKTLIKHHNPCIRNGLRVSQDCGGRNL